MRNGAAGLRRYGSLLDRADGEGRSFEPRRERARGLLVEPDDVALAQLARRRHEVLPLRDALAVHGDEPGLEGARVEGREQIPVLGRAERHALALALHDEARRDRLHPPGREPRHHLLPEHGRDLVAVEPVEDPAGLLGVDEAVVDLSRVGEGARDRVLRDLVEHHPPDGHLRLQHLDEMPGDRLALAILVRREQELVRLGEPFLQVGDDLLLLGIDDVVRLEALLHVDAERAEALALRPRDVLGTIREVADVADARPDGVVVAEVAGDGPRLGGRLDDDEALGHRRDTLAPDSAGAGPRYCNA